jgi:hypothetical protein
MDNIKDVDIPSEMERFYNKYVDFYKKGESDIAILSSLKDVLSLLKKRKSEYSETREKEIQQLGETLDMFLDESSDAIIELHEHCDYILSIDQMDKSPEDGLNFLRKWFLEYGVYDNAVEIILQELFEYWVKEKKLILHIGMLEKVIDKIIDEGYPDKLNRWKKLSSREQEQTIGSKVGRNYDKTAPQKPIQKKVKELAKENRYQDKEGNLKPTPIRDEIRDNYPEIMGSIQSRALFDRVKKALQNGKDDGSIFDMQ